MRDTLRSSIPSSRANDQKDPNGNSADSSRTSPPSTPGELSTTDRLLRGIGQEADGKFTHLQNIFMSPPLNPHLRELAKLADCPDHEKLDWAKANAEEARANRRIQDRPQKLTSINRRPPAMNRQRSSGSTMPFYSGRAQQRAMPAPSSRRTSQVIDLTGEDAPQTRDIYEMDDSPAAASAKLQKRKWH